MVMRYPRDPQLSDKAFKVTSSLFDYLPNAQTIVSIRGLQKTIAPGATIQYDPSAVAANLFNNIKDFTISEIGIQPRAASLAHTASHSIADNNRQANGNPFSAAVHIFIFS